MAGVEGSSASRGIEETVGVAQALVAGGGSAPNR